ncbi:unnamed protein product [Mytilus edulis]|uniref:Uncharacterized protein n=1 Tax=Mytilus edulis TaxID=6550 RepID=A0A8S3SFU9_MYTED|nr:unnamed protein product [Mytilus edulis]
MTMGSMMCPTCPVINCPTTQSTCPPTVSTSTSTIQPTTTGQSCDVNELQALRDEIVEWNFCQTISNSEDCNNNARCTLNMRTGCCHVLLFYLSTIITEELSYAQCQQQDSSPLLFLYGLGSGITIGSSIYPTCPTCTKCPKCPACPMVSCPQSTVTCPPVVSILPNTIEPCQCPTTTTSQPCNPNELQSLRDEIVAWTHCQTISNTGDCNNDPRCFYNVNCGPIQNK